MSKYDWLIFALAVSVFVMGVVFAYQAGHPKPGLAKITVEFEQEGDKLYHIQSNTMECWAITSDTNTAGGYAIACK